MAVPGHATVEATGSSGAPVNYTLPIASDVVDGERLVECAPASGSTFPLGSTTVNCAASDTRSNRSGVSFR